MSVASDLIEELRAADFYRRRDILAKAEILYGKGFVELLNRQLQADPNTRERKAAVRAERSRKAARTRARRRP